VPLRLGQVLDHLQLVLPDDEHGLIDVEPPRVLEPADVDRVESKRLVEVRGELLRLGIVAGIPQSPPVGVPAGVPSLTMLAASMWLNTRITLLAGRRACRYPGTVTFPASMSGKCPSSWGK
jgi:hypothetical protein